MTILRVTVGPPTLNESASDLDDFSLTGHQLIHASALDLNDVGLLTRLMEILESPNPEAANGW